MTGKERMLKTLRFEQPDRFYWGQALAFVFSHNISCSSCGMTVK
jgi:hypothetical protein